MKTITYFVGALLLFTTAHADPDRFARRTFPRGDVQLQPLFDWWAFASQTTNMAVDLTQMDSYKLDAVSNVWLRLPPRPLPDWFRITVREDNIVVAGDMWKVDATIQPAPMMTKSQTIYLRHPPVKEIQDYKLARATYAVLKSAQANDVAAEQLWKSNIQAEAFMIQTNSATNAFGIAQPNLAQAQTLQQDSAATDANLRQLHANTEARESSVITAEKFLSNFPDRNVYWIDHFALRTGTQIDGIEVYDLGAAPGLTF